MGIHDTVEVMGKLPLFEGYGFARLSLMMSYGKVIGDGLPQRVGFCTVTIPGTKGGVHVHFQRHGDIVIGGLGSDPTA